MKKQLQQLPELKFELQKPAFADSVLPMTMCLAHSLRTILGRQLRTIPSSWPLSDRVLVWLLPSRKADVAKFHEKSGPSMMEIWKHHQLEHIDEELLRQLADRMERKCPGLIPLLLDIASALQDCEQCPHNWHEELRKAWRSRA